VICALAAVAVPQAEASATRPPRVGATEETAALLSNHLVHGRPAAGSRALVTVPARRPITGERTTLPVIGRARGSDGIGWLKVMLPGRPNGSSGWIAQQGTRTLVTGWRLVVSLAARRVTVYRHGRVLRRFRAVVGKPSTPTPTGSFFVEETLQMPTGDPGGPFALALSARSDALQEFDGGPGQIALHGRDELGGTLGAAESHGCVRLATQSIDWLAQRIGPGVPVTIYAG
jgi:lipoprotein-anchoring transpeptidase ErfK/SrfK